jgi:hypothetical protein
MFHISFNITREKRLELCQQYPNPKHVIVMKIQKSYPMKISATGLILFASLTMLVSFTSKKPVPADRFNVEKTVSISNTLFIHSIYKEIHQAGATLSEEIFSLAFAGFEKLNAQGRLSTDSILTIIDFSKSSRENRLFVVDLKAKQLLFKSIVAHGRNTGEEFARSFSNAMNSHKSSLGFYVTGGTYMGSNGFSMQLNGVEKGFNDKAKERAIVMHGADYASEQVIRYKGYLGRSYGCPALPRPINKKVIETIKEGNCLFMYYPDHTYLSNSRILNG